MIRVRTLPGRLAATDPPFLAASASFRSFIRLDAYDKCAGFKKRHGPTGGGPGALENTKITGQPPTPHQPQLLARRGNSRGGGVGVATPDVHRPRLVEAGRRGREHLPFASRFRSHAASSLGVLLDTVT